MTECCFKLNFPCSFRSPERRRDSIRERRHGSFISSRDLKHRLGQVAVTLYLLSAFSTAGAGEYVKVQPNELLVLPPYCMAKFDGSHHPDLVAQWKDMPGFGSVHHYCIGLNFLNRAYRSIGREQIENSIGARDSFDYCINNWPENNPLMPEIYLNRGTAMRFLGNNGKAVQNYYKALSLNPRLRSAYVKLADYFIAADQRAEGLKIVTEGLRYLPEDTALRRLYTETGGRLPYPAPIEQAAQKAEQATVSEGADKNPAPATSSTEGQAATPKAEDAPKDGLSPAPDNSSTAGEPKIGSPNNPWCRFCPPE